LGVLDIDAHCKLSTVKMLHEGRYLMHFQVEMEIHGNRKNVVI